jgi:uncharacterized protein YecE (DUF72 family)
MNFKEGQRFLLEQSIFNRHILEVTYVDNTTAYLKLHRQDTLTDYRYSVKSGKLHHWNKAMQSWDLVEDYTLTEYIVNDVMSKYKPEDVVIYYEYKS